MADVRTIRADDGTMARLKEICEEMGCTQGQALAQLVQLWQGQQLRGLAPGRKDEMDAYEAALTRLRELYQGSVAMWVDARQVARDEIRLQMEQQQATIALLTEQLQEARQQASDMVAELQQLRQLRDTQAAALADKDRLIEQLRAEIAAAAAVQDVLAQLQQLRDAQAGAATPQLDK